MDYLSHSWQIFLAFLSGVIRNVFWILFILELSLLIWWTIDQRIHKYNSGNPYIVWGFIWLVVSLLCKKVFRLQGLALIMVWIPGIPILAYLVFLLAVMIIALFSGPIRWN